MVATLTHPHAGSRELVVRKSPRSVPSWVVTLIAFISMPGEILAEASEEMRKAHKRFPFAEW